MKNTLYNVFKYIVIVLTLFVLSYCAISAFFFSAYMETNMDEITLILSDNLIVNLVMIVVFIIALSIYCVLTKKIKSKYLFVCSAICLSIFILYLISHVNLTPTWDALRTYDAGVQFVKGDYSSFSIGGYIYNYPFQIPILLYDGVLSLIFGENYIIPQLINTLYLIGTYYFLYRGTLVLSDNNENAGKICILLTTIFFPLHMYVLFIYSNIPSVFFMTCGLYNALVFLKCGKNLNLVLSFILLGIAALFKGTAYIALIALIICLFMYLTKKYNRKVLLISIALFISVLFAPKVLNNIVEMQDESIDLSNNLYIEYALEMGSKRGQRGAGWYDSWLQNHLMNDFDNTADRKKEAWRIINENVSKICSSPSSFALFMCDKANSMWINSEFQGFWTIQANKNEQYGMGDPSKQSLLWIKYSPENDSYGTFLESFMNGEINSIIRSLMNTMQNIVYIASIIYLITIIKKKSFEIFEILLPLTFLGGFVFLLFWEAKAQYSVLFYILLFPISSIALSNIYISIVKTLKNKRVSI